MVSAGLARLKDHNVIEEIYIQQVRFIDVSVIHVVFILLASEIHGEIRQKRCLDHLIYPEKHHKPYKNEYQSRKFFKEMPSLYEPFDIS